MHQLKTTLSLPQPRVLLPLVILFGVILTASFRVGLLTRVHAAGSFVVTNTNDSGAGSLRQAILDSNSNPGVDLISFSIGSGPQTIAPTSSLPEISDPVTIDGSTQPSLSANPIELNASNYTSLPNQAVLTITGGNTTVRSLIINHFSNGGISITTAGGDHIEGCYIGTDASGTATTNSHGAGISIQAPNNFIGGTSPHSGNVISGLSNTSAIVTSGSGTGNQIQGNYIGTDATGTKPLANLNGISLSSSNNTVGGTVAEARNVIAASTSAGIVMQVSGTSGNVVQGNYIGTDVTGQISLGNPDNGMILANATNNNTIGGTIPGARNVISGNGRGILLTASSGAPSGNVFQGNYIGVAADGLTPLPNRVQGILLEGALNTTVGGVTAGAGNIVAFNGPTAESEREGIEVLGGTGNSIRGNSIFSNGRVGIDLDGGDVTPNDVGDGDSGANNRQNFPIITSVTSDATQTTISGTLNSTANTILILDFYGNSVCDASGFGEGARRIGSTNVTTNGTGDTTFNVAFAPALAANQVVTATATDPSGNTSEFSQCSPSSPAIGSVGFVSTAVSVSESTGMATFGLSRTGGSAGSITIGYAVTGQTATVGADFVATQGTITFADGETSKSISVPIVEDNVDEPNPETAAVTLSTSGALDTLGAQNIAILTIIDNDPTPLISIGDIAAVEGFSWTSNFNFPVTLSNPSSDPVTISFVTVNGSATAGNDYIATAGSVTIPAGQTSGTITIEVIGDAGAEGDETFFVTLTEVTTNNAIFLDSQAKATIVNDDATPTTMAIFGNVTDFRGATMANVTITLRYDRMSVIETLTTHTDGNGNYNTGQIACANSVTVTPSLTGRKFGPSSTTFVNTCADQLLNFSELPPIVISQLYTSGGDTGATYQNDFVELFNRGDASVDLGGWSIQYAAAGGTSWQRTVIPFVTLLPGQHLLIREGSGGSNGTLFPADVSGSINMSSTAGKVVLLSTNLSLPAGTCPLSSGIVDFVGYGATADCFEGSAPAPAPNATNSDRRSGDGCVDTDNNAADFALGTPNPRNRVSGVSPCGAGATLQFSSAAKVVGEGDGKAVITVTRGGNLSGTTTVDFLTSDDTAKQSQDYIVNGGTLTFAPGETSKTFNVLIVDDAFIESDKSLNLTLSNLTGATLSGPSADTLRITDNDIAGSISPLSKRFFAALDGAQETPANNSTARGTGTVLLNANDTSALVGLQFQNLSSAETALHIHGNGAPGVAAPILFPLTPPITNPLLNFSIAPTTQQVADLRATLHYQNVHSNNFPNGEIRGQLRWNPTLEDTFFVRQQYLDFLSREPDTNGFNFWVSAISGCQANVQCFQTQSNGVSDAFFFEPEFQQTAGFVFRAYRAGFGNAQPFPLIDGFNQTEANKLVDYSVYVKDRARVIGGADLATAQLAFANLFVSRSEFTSKYPLNLTGPQFVAAILATIQTADGVDLSGQTTALVNEFNTGGRGQVLYRLADDNAQTNPINNQAFIDAEYNRQFALTLYFGYLRRNPDIRGFLFWQDQINSAPVRNVPKQNALVCSFMTSQEYQFRFGSDSPRSNAECPP
jgi:hypothetical protein